MAAARTVTNRTQNIGVNALSRETGLPATTVSKMMTRGKTPDDIRAYAKLKFGERTPDGAPPVAPATPTVSDPKEFDIIMQTRSQVFELEKAKLRRARALAERQEIENLVKTGELYPISEMRRFMFQYMMDGRDQIARLPELAEEMVSIDDPVKARQVLADYGERIMAKFGQMITWIDSISAAANEAAEKVA
jgi:hypothetical protein